LKAINFLQSLVEKWIVLAIYKHTITAVVSSTKRVPYLSCDFRHATVSVTILNAVMSFSYLITVAERGSGKFRGKRPNFITCLTKIVGTV
jgi:hypothetical protein